MCRTFHLADYRQFTWWMHKRLGHRVTHEIACCVVLATHSNFPDKHRHYANFREVNANEDCAYPDSTALPAKPHIVIVPLLHPHTWFCGVISALRQDV